ncbi:MAG: S-adenosylmethionine:tRNA ribosyltransferase-isomerase [Leptospiraceae bacterium]|nr:MAG: S-adenosylmethionine:tRNA ribosyltransferase-isomerase [Leptospiraceae bacterium]
MNRIKNINELPEELKEYYFELPEEYIAKYPIIPRDHAKLMVLQNQKIQDDYFYNLDKYLPENSILVFNRTKVSFRRVYLFHERTKKYFEVLFLDLIDKNLWKCLIKNGRKIKKNDVLKIKDYFFQLERRDEKFFYLSAWKNNISTLENYQDSESFFDEFGLPPIPPYLKREAEDIDKEYYQTIFALEPGSVAAPTASLHFTEELLKKISQKHKILYLNLRIGYGTFSPLGEKEIQNKELHEEYYQIPEETAQILNESKNKNPIIAVGTTTLRALEDNFLKFKQFKEGNYSTKLFIKPPDLIYSSDYLITNFHLPASSLFLLVCAFGGKDYLKYSYQYAIQKKYRFFSYGDGMIIQNQKYFI